jgi:hypothetical protein
MIRVCLLLTITACTCGNTEHDSHQVDSPPQDSEPVDQGPCVDPQPILAKDGAPTGYERCTDGSVNRVENGVVLGGDYSGDIRPCEDWVEYGCDSDDECQDPSDGRCAYSGGTFGFPPSCECTWPCASDADCSALEVCLPPEVHELRQLNWPICVPAHCRTGESCGSGECAVLTLLDCGWGVAELRCRQDSDECRSNLECENNQSGGDYCWRYDDPVQCHFAACD